MHAATVSTVAATGASKAAIGRRVGSDPVTISGANIATAAATTQTSEMKPASWPGS